MPLDDPTVSIFRLDRPLYGTYEHSKRQIGINVHQRIPIWRRKTALMHEIFHWLDHTYGLQLPHRTVHHAAIACMIDKHSADIREWGCLLKDAHIDIIDPKYVQLGRQVYKRLAKKLKNYITEEE